VRQDAGWFSSPAASSLFDQVVADDGALLYCPKCGEETPLGEPPPDVLVGELRRRGVAPLTAGRVIVATWQPNKATVLSTIRELVLEHQLVFNRGAVMVLPPGINKGTGLAAALRRLGISPRNTVGIGDAENDHAFLQLCECAVAVGNALPMVQAAADLVTRGSHGADVAALADASPSESRALIARRYMLPE
jgi:hypothetical protein